MNIYKYIDNIRKNNGFCLFALIDPDKKNDNKLTKMIRKINKGNFNAILIGGSSIEDDLIEKRIEFVKNNTSLPIILFPGSSEQITSNVQAILYLNLISGRNPQYLIEEQVKGAQKIHNFNIETIPTAYILLDGGNKSSVSIASNTLPLSMNNKEEILSHALAGMFMGNQIIYFDCGSGAVKHISNNLLKYLKQYINLPIMIGGGISSFNQVKNLALSGASHIVVGNAIEDGSYID